MRTSRKATLGFIFVTVLIDATGFGLIFPILPKLIAQMINGDISTAASYGGWLTFAYALMQFLFAPVLGNLSDRYGRRPVLLISLLGFSLDCVFLAFAPTIGWLFVGRVIAGIAGASHSVASSYVADTSSDEDKSKNFGILNAGFGAGFIIGPVIGGLLGQYGTHMPFLVAAGLSMMNFLYGLFVLPESLAPENRRPFEWKRANVVGSFTQLRQLSSASKLIIALTLSHIAGHSMETTWSYYTMQKFGWNEAWVGYSLGFIGVMYAVVQAGLVGFILPKTGDKRGAFLGMLIAGVSMFLFAFASEGWMMFAFMVPYAIGGISYPAIQSMISNAFPANEQGELQGGLTSLMSLAGIVSPPIMTSLFTHFSGKHAPFYFPGAAFFLAALLMLASAVMVSGKSKNE